MKNPFLSVSLLAFLLIVAWIILAAMVLTDNSPEKVEQPISCGTVSNFPNLSGEEVEQYRIGKKLFIKNCASCHNKNMKSKLTGPPLGGVVQRWDEFPKEDLYNMIRNSKALIEKGHPRAKALWNEFKPTQMESFPDLQDDEIDAILAFIEIRYNHK